MEDYFRSLSPEWWDLTPNQRRTLRQADIHQSWINNFAYGYVEAVTGFGKTHVGVNAINRCFERDPNRIINIIVPHKAAFDVWAQVKAESKVKRIRVCMAHTYFKLRPDQRECDMLLVDEGHRFTNERAELFGRVIDETKNKWLLILSASFSEEHRKFLAARKIPRIAKVTMKEARLCEYVAEHYNWIVDMETNAVDEESLQDINRRYHGLWGIWNYDMDEIFLTLRGGQEGRDRRAYYSQFLPPDTNPGVIYKMAKDAIAVMNERKVFLQKAPSKIEVVKKIVNRHPNCNILTFGEYTDVADRITKELGSIARSFHGRLKTVKRTEYKTKTYVRREAMQKFMQKNDTLPNLKCVPMERGGYQVSWTVEKPIGVETQKKENMAAFENPNSPVRVLNTVKSLDEAATIENVSVGILVSYTSTARQTIQRIGRLIRWAEGKIAHIYILCLGMRNGLSQEQKWLREALEEIDEFKRIRVEILDIAA